MILNIHFFWIFFISESLMDLINNFRHNLTLTWLTSLFIYVLKENWTLKSSLSLLKEHFSFSFWFPCFVFEIFLRYFVFLICKSHIWRSIRAMTYRIMLYMFAFIKRNHFEVIMYVCFSHDTKHVHFGVISFYHSKDI